VDVGDDVTGSGLQSEMVPSAALIPEAVTDDVEDSNMADLFTHDPGHASGLNDSQLVIRW